MMTFEQMKKKMGTKKAIDTVTHCRRNGPTGADRDRGVKGRVRYRMCEHGTFIIENYEPKICEKCIPEVRTKGKDFQPYFNIGLGAWVESRSEEKRVAKSKGLVEAG